MIINEFARVVSEDVKNALRVLDVMLVIIDNGCTMH